MKKLIIIIMWIVFFPLMLTYWGWKAKKKPVMAIGAVLSLLFIVFGLVCQKAKEQQISDGHQTAIVETTTTEQPTVDTENKISEQSENSPSKTASDDQNKEETINDIKENTSAICVTNNTELFKGYTLIEVDGGDLSGHREPNVVVDIGFGDREYWAFTNESGQLVKVIADKIILQDDNTEPVTSEGRYYTDEAKVPGTEVANLDEGHVIADSLGGVSNAYNITPQNSTLNRYGDQAYMEKGIREAGGCTDFVAIITYPKTTTQIPSHYSFTYNLKGNVINDEFDNVNPDEVNAELNVNSSNAEKPTVTITPVPQQNISGLIEITALNKKAEYVEIKNVFKSDMNMTDWYIVSVKGEQIYNFTSGYILKAGQSIKIGGYGAKVDLEWIDGKGVWNNNEPDAAELYDNKGQLVDRWDDLKK